MGENVDPFGPHKKPVKNCLCKMLVEHLSKGKNVDINLIPGQALCPTCASRIYVEKPVETAFPLKFSQPPF